MMVVKVWKEIYQKFPEWNLNILGDGAAGNEMKEYSKKHGLKNIHFHGMVSNVSEYLEKSSICMLTSNCEGLGVALVEAAMYGNALISTKSHGGVIDIIPDADHGLRSPRNDIAGFVANMKLLMSDPALRMKLGNNARKRVSMFRDEKIISEWKQLFSELGIR